jgi:hypothetical protein
MAPRASFSTQMSLLDTVSQEPSIFTFKLIFNEEMVGKDGIMHD